MNIKSLYKALPAVLTATLLLTGCFEDDDIYQNPNASERATPSTVLNHLTANMVLADEMPYGAAHRTNQYYVSNYSYYWGSNYYNWTSTAERYELIRYAVKLDEEAERQYGKEINIYQALSRFYKAYAAIWFSQRVGDIPFGEAGDPDNLTPAFDAQQEVYAQALALLKEANTIMHTLITRPSAYSVSGAAALDRSGDIFGLTNLQWQKVINAYRLRILVSLSRRADDAPALAVKEAFGDIVNNPAQNPVMESNADNLAYIFNAAYNPYPTFNLKSYTYGANIGKTILDITTATQDPRTFIYATPAPAQYKTAAKPVSDFTAYAGASTNTPQAILNAGTDAKGTTDEDRGEYSYINYRRYFASQDGSTAEPYLVIGYPEMCFNIAEAIARGWLSGDAQGWYMKGINASLQLYGIAGGSAIVVADRQGGVLGAVTPDLDAFFRHIAYRGNGAAGIEQIVTQKYVAMFNNSGFEAFYNWLRTGYPAFQQGGDGIGTADKNLSRRWMYPSDEISYNNDNYLASIQRQYAGRDVVTDNTWLNK
jgi:hypothetical protein